MKCLEINLKENNMMTNSFLDKEIAMITHHKALIRITTNKVSLITVRITQNIELNETIIKKNLLFILY